MAETSYPWNSTSTGDATTAPYDANSEWADLQKALVGAGAVRADAGVIFGSGSESAQLEGCQVTQNSPAAANVLVNIGRALADGTLYKNTSALTLTIAANASGNPRIDTIALRKDYTAQTVRAVVRQGTPAASPVPPTLTQTAGVTWEIPLADIAVANGFVSITNANITPRYIPANASDRLSLNMLNNNSGAVITGGSAANLDSTADRAITTTAATVLTRLRRIGVIQGRFAAGALNSSVMNRGICHVMTSAAVTRGHYVNPDVGAATFAGTALPTLFSVGQFLETTSVAGIALAFIDMGQHAHFGYITTSALAAPAASISISNAMPYDTVELEFYIRSAVAATTDTINIKFHPASIAGNYYSYYGAISNSVPVLGALQNLGAVAGVQFTAPGATAPADYFAYGRLLISNANNARGAVKLITGTFYLQRGNANGDLFVANLGASYTNVNAVVAITFTSNGGSNIAANSYINAYARQI